MASNGSSFDSITYFVVKRTFVLFVSFVVKSLKFILWLRLCRIGDYTIKNRSLTGN